MSSLMAAVSHTVTKVGGSGGRTTTYFSGGHFPVTAAIIIGVILLVLLISLAAWRPWGAYRERREVIVHDRAPTTRGDVVDREAA
jgi:hypothetical protein